MAFLVPMKVMNYCLYKLSVDFLWVVSEHERENCVIWAFNHAKSALNSAYNDAPSLFAHFNFTQPANFKLHALQRWTVKNGCADDATCCQFVTKSNININIDFTINLHFGFNFDIRLTCPWSNLCNLARIARFNQLNSHCACEWCSNQPDLASLLTLIQGWNCAMSLCANDCILIWFSKSNDKRQLCFPSSSSSYV